MSEPLGRDVLAAIARAGLARPRGPFPGREWRPRTDAETHLLREGCRLDRMRQLLLAEIERLRQANGNAPHREVTAAAARTAERLRECPLTQAQLGIIAAAAAGESPEDTARRLCLSYYTIKAHRQRAVKRLGARSIPHAVALCTAAGWVTARQVTGGVAP